MSRISAPKYYLLNLNLNSDFRLGKDVLSSFFSIAKEERKKLKVRGSDALYIRLFFQKNIEGEQVFYGRFSKFIDLGGKSSKDIETAEDLNIHIPENAAFDLKEVNFTFYPKYHRLAVEKSSSLSINYIVQFLEKIFNQFLKDNEHLTITLQQSEDQFEEIISAKIVKSLVIQVSYTNDDTGEEAAEWFDEQMKISNSRSMKMQVNPDNSGSINTNAKLLKGAIALSKENGYTIARIVDNNNRKKTINTQRHPEKNTILIKDYNHDPIKFSHKVKTDLDKRYGEKDR
ncbi:DUF4747 family protein [Litoribacter populi]|uniref:DUF4747 family protein n=1 Tax=Litoribacter populi TaxID=2598460 RepID=UPI00117F055D|nr:DUF4747 family protein [Litoribacter populi]